MRRKAVTLLAAVAVVLVAAGGASAAALSDSAELAPENGSTSSADVGICVVGADSPCNGEHAEKRPSERVDTNDSENSQILLPEDQNRDGKLDDRFTGDEDDKQIWIPEDRNRDGQIDDRFRGDDEGDQMWLPEDQNRDGQIDERFGGKESGEAVQPEPTDESAENAHPTPNTGDKISDDESDNSSDNQIWIPEDQNRDGQIDDRFTEDSQSILGGILSDLLGLF